MDTVSKEKRSKIMSAIHSRDTLPEVVVRKMLWENGYRFRVCDRRIVGHPDIVIPKCAKRPLRSSSGILPGGEKVTFDGTASLRWCGEPAAKHTYP